MDPKKVGNFGEEIAVKYLERKGYKILERNYTKNWSSIKKGEIDIICRKEKIISFVEVKTIIQSFQNNLSPFSPEEKVNRQKQKKIILLAETWLEENNISLNSDWQIDVIAIRVDLARKKAKISHFLNAVEG